MRAVEDKMGRKLDLFLPLAVREQLCKVTQSLVCPCERS